MLKPDQVSTPDRLACTAWLFILLSLSHREQRSLIVIILRLKGHNLLSGSATVVRADRGEEHAANGVLKAQGR